MIYYCVGYIFLGIIGGEIVRGEISRNGPRVIFVRVLVCGAGLLAF